MPEEMARESVLADVAPREAHPASAPDVLCEQPFRGYFNLRGDDPGLPATVAGVLALELPREANTVSTGEYISALWLGPDEWLLMTPDERDTDLLQVLRGASGDAHFALTDVSSAYTTIRIRGDDAWQTLAKGCTLDLHPGVFGPGRCAQTLLAKTDVIVQPLADQQLVDEQSPGFDLIVRRSFADYLWHWLTDAVIR